MGNGTKRAVRIQTKRLLLRPLDIADLETAYPYSTDPEITRYMMFYPHGSMEETRKFLEGVTAEWKNDEPENYEFAVMLGETHIGSVSLYVLDEERKTGELAWMLVKKYQGQGYATEAARALLEYAAQKLGMTKIIAQCDARNTASRRVMEKLGMKLLDSDGIRVYPQTGEEAKELTYAADFSANFFIESESEM